MANKTNSMAYMKWMCKYHIVFTSKYRRKAIYNQYKESIRDIIKQLCAYKGVEIIEGHLMPDHIHMLVNTAKVQGVKFYGEFEREKCLDDIRQARKLEVEIRKPAFLGGGILRQHSRPERGNDKEVYLGPREKWYYAGQVECKGIRGLLQGVAGITNAL